MVGRDGMEGSAQRRAGWLEDQPYTWPVAQSHASTAVPIKAVPVPRYELSFGHLAPTVAVKQIALVS